MKNKLMILTKADFFKSWGKAKIITVAILCIVFCVLSALPAMLKMFDGKTFHALPFGEYLIGIWKIIIPFAALFFSSGIISGDIKNHWLRTVLSHSVTRQDLVISKLISAVTSVFIIMILLGVAPTIVFMISSNIDLNISFLPLLQLFIYSILEATLFVSMAIWLSCFLNGFMNVFLLAGWMFLDNVVMKGILSMWLSTSYTGNILMDFFFPSGFSEAAAVIGPSNPFPTEFLLWGFAALTFFIAAGLYNINFVKIDINSD